jgi:histidinol-phosphate/aromatic aminotransferase/cobyric acid decarboxylase-like protein
MNPDEINLQYTTIKSPLPEFIYKELKEFSHRANAYQPQPEELVSILAKKHNLKNENIYLTAGIDEALQMFILKFGTRTTIFTPAYTVYTDVEIFGNKLTKIPSLKNNEYVIEPRIFSDATLIILANPNNPCGFSPKEKIIELIEKNKHAMIVIDEAYGEFAPELSMIEYINKYPNLSVLRSFSKDYSMAGNRIGYIVSSSETIQSVKPMCQWANVSYLSIGAAVSALKHEDYFRQIREDINKQREEFAEFLKKQGFTVLPSKINALVVKFETEKQGKNFYDYLLNNNIRTSLGNGNSNVGLDDSFVRISIGTKEQLEILKEVITNFRN